MLLVIKFYYCKICGLYIDKYHLHPHETDDEYFGYQVFYNEIDNKYYIQDTYSSNSVSTDSETDNYLTDEWLFCGIKEELLYLIINKLDLKITNRYIDPTDCDYIEINILYQKILDYFY